MNSDSGADYAPQLSPRAEHTISHSLLIALPPVLVALLTITTALAGVPLRRLVIGGPTPFRPDRLGVWHAIPASLGLLLIGGALWSLLKGLPRWSYTWIYAVLVLVTFVLVVMADERPALVSPAVDSLIAVAILGALAGVALLTARRGPSDALVAGIGFSSAFTLVSCSTVTSAPFNRLDLAFLALPAGLVFGALITAAERAPAAMRWAALALTIVLDVTLMWLCASAISGSWALQADGFAKAVLRFAVAGLIIPPLLAGLWQLRRTAVAL
jgi:hypothetical protein